MAQDRVDPRDRDRMHHQGELYMMLFSVSRLMLLSQADWRRDPRRDNYRGYDDPRGRQQYYSRQNYHHQQQMDYNQDRMYDR